MKQSLRCPKCQNRKLWVVDSVDLARTVDIALDADMIAGLREMGEKIEGSPTAQTAENARGFEAWVCAQCGYTETYATTLDHVAKVGKTIDGDAPYR